SAEPPPTTRAFWRAIVRRCSATWASCRTACTTPWSRPRGRTSRRPSQTAATSGGSRSWTIGRERSLPARDFSCGSSCPDPTSPASGWCTGRKGWWGTCTPSGRGGGREPLARGCGSGGAGGAGAGGGSVRPGAAGDRGGDGELEVAAEPGPRRRVVDGGDALPPAAQVAGPPTGRAAVVPRRSGVGEVISAGVLQDAAEPA